MSTGTRALTGSASAPKLAAYWFGIQLAWGAVLGISLQARCVQLAGSASLATYGEISALGALAAAVTQILVGFWSDALRRRGNNRAGFYVAGAIAGAAAIVAFYVAATPLELLAAFVALQLGLNFAIGPYQAILPDTVDDARLGRASAWMAAMQSARQCGGRRACDDSRESLGARSSHRRCAAWNVCGNRFASAGVAATRRSTRAARCRNAHAGRSFHLTRVRICRLLHDSRLFVFLRPQCSDTVRACGSNDDHRRGNFVVYIGRRSGGGAGGKAVGSSRRTARRHDRRQCCRIGCVSVSVVARDRGHARCNSLRGHRLGRFPVCGLGVCVPAVASSRTRNHDGHLESRGSRAANACAYYCDCYSCALRRACDIRRTAYCICRRSCGKSGRDRVDLAFTR